MYSRKKQGSRGMTYLRGSASYVWSTGCILGRGATATVYQGVNKKTGDLVAVKTFNKVSLDRPLNVQMREFDVLKKVNHENIVKLIAIEEELESASKILVMELCTGGSLFSILDDPMNSYGLEEDEFLLVLKDLTAGMKHLRDNNIIHRDLKPGNIMKYVAENGRSIYKLTDFGAARELEDDQQFMSLYGTEEYLHPAMYERAVLRKHGDQRFSSNVDLWSIGVTLYHVATGNLPFRPYGGRRNREVMHYITTKKDSGVISGVQRDHTTSSIEWSRDLPKSCLLSSGLRKSLVPVLAGLMECDSGKMWSFERFFNETTKILAAKRIHVFHVNDCKEYILYILNAAGKSTAGSLADVTEHVLRQSGVLSKNQLLFFEQQPLEQYANDNAVVPETTVINPVFLFNTENRDVGIGLTSTLEFGSHGPFKYPDFNPAVALDEDAATAKSWCSVSHAIKRQIERLSRIYAHLTRAPLHLCSHLEDEIVKLKRQLTIAQINCRALERQISLLARSEKHVGDLADLVPAPCFILDRMRSILAERQKNIYSVSGSLERVGCEVKSLEANILDGKKLQRSWKLRTAEIPPLTGCDQIAATYVNKIRENWQALARDKVAKTLSYHDEQFHVLEKHKMAQISARLMALLQEQSVLFTSRLAQKLQSWYREAVVLHRQTQQIVLALGSFGDMSQWCLQASETEDDFDHLVGQFVDLLKTQSSAASHNNNDGRCQNKDRSATNPLLSELKELKRQQFEILQIVDDSQAIMFRMMNIPTGNTVDDKTAPADRASNPTNL
ncbi:serine/threonine-protein kinase TBK1 [Galendromus occidentalis]|uniref:Serine/threonine-protein kinase TBK1 n=1 Tax=Galendromus occidentalis TaxID=34638 RepID=A0AAJ6QR77_9ACAR|nr:serine/threonine-protein kinase TBK1 [Galendromus occidentalis]